jgi:hypothetical protein
MISAWPWLLEGVDQRLVAGQRLHGVGQQQPFDLEPARPGTTAPPASIRPAHTGFDLRSVLLGDHAAVDLQHDLAWHHIRVACRRRYGRR